MNNIFQKETFGSQLLVAEADPVGCEEIELEVEEK